MEITAAAAWLNSFFSGYDELILKFFHSIACSPLTFLAKLITFIGEHGVIFYIAAVVLACFSKTRKKAVCIFGAVCCGALITNLILKDTVARIRPYEALETYRDWWKYIGRPAEEGYSFPSGHATAAAAGMVALRLVNGKKWTAPAAIWIVLTCCARNYLMAHYPSDVLIGTLIGIASAFIAWGITKLIFRFLDAYQDVPVFGWMRNFDIPDLFGIPSRLGLLGGPDEAAEPVVEESAPKKAKRKLREARKPGIIEPDFDDELETIDVKPRRAMREEQQTPASRRVREKLRDAAQERIQYEEPAAPEEPKAAPVQEPAAPVCSETEKQKDDFWAEFDSDDFMKDLLDMDVPDPEPSRGHAEKSAASHRGKAGYKGRH